MDITDFDLLNAEEFDDKKRKERLEYLKRIPRYTREDMESFAKYYHSEMQADMHPSMADIFSDWEDETQ